MRPVAKTSAPKAAQAPTVANAAKKPVKSASINEILRRAWEDHMRRQGLDPHNPPKRAISEKLPQRCGHYLEEGKIRKMVEEHKKGKEASAKPVEQHLQTCGQPYIQARIDEMRDKLEKALKTASTKPEKA